MEKERKIIKSISELQKSLFDYKNYVRKTPFEISRKEADILFIETARNAYYAYSHFNELLHLMQKLKPEELKGEVELREMDKTIGKFKAIIDLADRNIGKDKEQ